MTKNVKSLETRFKDMQELYKNIEMLNETIPNPYVQKMSDAILTNEDLNEFMENISKYRAPRILLVGKDDVGKSSIINALMDKYVANIDDTKEGEYNIYYSLLSKGEAPVEFLDTGNIRETVHLYEGSEQQEKIFEEIIEFEADICLLVLDASSREGIEDDMNLINEIRQIYYLRNNTELPVIAVLNKVDLLEPGNERLPYSKEKLKNILEIKNAVRVEFKNHNFQINAIVPVSCIMEWKDEKSYDVKSIEELNNLSDEERDHLKLVYDGRYHFDKLIKVMEKYITDPNAVMGLKLAFSLNDMLYDVANNFVKVFIGIATIMVGASIAVADFYVLVILETIMVMLIMAISGRDMSMNSAKEFIASLTGTAGAGLAFRQIARISIKFIPVAGNLISAAVAGSGVKMIGDAAIKYYVLDYRLTDVRKEFKKDSRTNKIIIKSKQLTHKAVKKIRSARNS